ncbi:carboxymuconolactone decarboxylase family protein [Mycolicibacterium mucogenicum]|uniref:carboxymuconolactone decarboxylase family protein n=1 Tax=Mycolicibacterium mucogenicum TaxID=56689 RepID=UPI002269D91E|nr:carboxymuconolactone decarboxylase family protein [Mycolicibacterium mucogenicum]MCX8555050.1 carboxymuconolactone decarboxylase family protein [Mycolicibacterium mucogenicum]
MKAKPGILSRIRKTGPALAEPKPSLKLPDGEWIGLTYPGRIPPLRPRELKLWQKLFLTAIRIGAGDTYDYTCFLVTARLGKVMPLHTLFFTQLLQHGGIPQADNERIVTRVAWRMGCQYEYAHHTRMALELGVPRDEVESLTNENDPGWSPRIRTLLTATDELLATRNLAPETYLQLRRELDENQVLEFATLVGHYVMASMMLSVAGVEIEPAFALT